MVKDFKAFVLRGNVVCEHCSSAMPTGASVCAFCTRDVAS